MARRRDHVDDGFTLIELMVVVLIIAILLAIAIPTFLGARERANDRRAQSLIRNTLTAQMTFFADNSTFTEDTNALRAIDSSMVYTATLSDVAASSVPVYVDVPPAGTDQPFDTVYVAARSREGVCFWMRMVGGRGQPRFADDDCTGTTLAFRDRW